MSEGRNSIDEGLDLLFSVGSFRQSREVENAAYVYKRNKIQRVEVIA